MNGVSTRHNATVSPTAPTKVNGIADKPSTERKGKPPVETPQTETSPSPTPVNVGKKRKKSSS